MQNNKILFVYGTLKRNCRGNYMLQNASFLGSALTTTDYELYGGFTYPALIRAKNHGYSVDGELYEVDQETMNLLDIYEGVESGLYKCEKIKLLSVENDILPLNAVEIYSYIYYGNMRNFSKIQKWTCT